METGFFLISKRTDVVECFDMLTNRTGFQDNNF